MCGLNDFKKRLDMIKIKNITLSAEDEALQKARRKAQKEGKSLNVKFREWLRQYVHPRDYTQNYEKLMASLSHIRAGKKFSRDQANER